jgi:uncharacterized protein YecT (DUF1311 family)
MMRFTSLVLTCVAFVALGAARADAAVKVAKRNISATAKTYSLSIDYPATGVKAIDDVLARYAKDQAAADKDVDEGDESQHNGDRPYDFATTFEIARNDARVFSVVFTEYSDTGGAHPNTNLAAFNFLMPDGALVYLPELVDGQRGIAQVSKIVVADLNKRIGGPDGMSDADWIRRGAGARATNFAVFVLEPRQIHIFFPPYQVAAYAAGPQEAKVPLVALKGFMRTDPRAPQASFDCAKAATTIEHAICGDAMLARLDRQTAEQYADDLANAYDKDKEQKWRETQRAWLAARDKICGMPEPAQCLRKSYADRLSALKKYSPE